MKKLKKLNLNRFYTSIIFVIFSNAIMSCNKNGVKEYEARFLKFSVPCKDNVKHVRRSDFAGAFVINDVDTAYYNFGYRISSLNEKLPELVILPDMTDEELKMVEKNNTDFKRFSNVANSDPDRLRKQNIFFMHHGVQLWKYSKPVDTSQGGMLGIYVDSVLIDPKGVVKFNFYFNHIRKMSYLEAEKIVNSLIINNNEIKKVDFYLTNIQE